MKGNFIITIIICLVIGGAAGFFGGVQYQKSQRGSFAGAGRGGFGGGQFGQRSGAGNASFRPVAGEIIGKDANSITVKLQDGSSKIVLVSDKTAINKAATATADDLKTGEQVAAFGTQNSDGSMTAQTIQLNPQMRAFGRPSGTPTQ